MTNLRTRSHNFFLKKKKKKKKEDKNEHSVYEPLNYKVCNDDYSTRNRLLMRDNATKPGG